MSRNSGVVLRVLSWWAQAAMAFALAWWCFEVGDFIRERIWRNTVNWVDVIFHFWKWVYAPMFLFALAATLYVLGVIAVRVDHLLNMSGQTIAPDERTASTGARQAGRRGVA